MAEKYRGPNIQSLLDLINPKNRYLDKEPFRYEKGVDTEKFIDKKPFRPGDLEGVDLEDFIQPLSGKSGKSYNKEIYTVNGVQVTKEVWEAAKKASKKETEQYEKESAEQNIIFGDISDLTFKSQKLYDMKLEQLDLPKGSHLPIDEHIELMDALRRLDEKLGKGTYIHNPEDPIRSLESFANGGLMGINRMTAPLGYKRGGPAPKENGGLQPPTGLSKWYADKFPVDPIHQLKENIIDKGKRTIKGIGRGISGLAGIGQELLGAGPVEAGTFTEDLDLEIITLESAIQGLQLDEMFTGTDNSKAITSKQNLLEYYRSLK